MSTRLKDSQLIAKTGSENGSIETVRGTDLGDTVVMLYFSGHWCAPCRQFTPILRQWYEKVHRDGQPIEIVFVSADRSEEEQLQYYRQDQGDWMAIKWGDEALEKLPKELSVRGVPTLVVVDKEGNEVVDSNECIQTVVQSLRDPNFDLNSKLTEWRKLAGDWTAKGKGNKLNANGGSSTAATTTEEKRAQRLAAIERRRAANQGNS